ncbi:MAG: hypothetical protein JNL58_08025 [Planctomyces sp.]|nr:hypothetical protein [Planctomyces sp.]
MTNEPRMNHRFILPESFDPSDSLPPKLHRYCDDARYFVATVLTKISRGQVDEDGNVRLAAKYLRNIMNFRNYRHVIDALLEADIVERGSYLIGVKSFGYRLSERFVNDRHVRVAPTDRRLIQRLEAYYAEHERNRRSQMKPVHKALERHQRRLSIDRDHASEILQKLPPGSNPWDTQNVLICDIDNRNFHLSIGTYGRVSNNITSLKRELRHALRLRKDPLCNADVRCCQPALLGQLAHEATRKHGKTGGVCNYDVQIGADIDSFIELVQSGGFYEFLVVNLKNRSCPVFTRDDAKKRFLTDVLAKRGTYRSAVEDVFREHFPTVYNFIRSVNRDGAEHANLIRLLQRAESDLVIHTVAADLVVSRPEMFFMTLHDSIFATERDLPFVAEAFEAAFKRRGYSMSLKLG